MRHLICLLQAGFLACMTAGGAWSDPPAKLLRELGLAPVARADQNVVSAQLDLSWIGLYDGRLDGLNRAGLNQAIRQFQSSLGNVPTGRLSPEERRTLSQRADVSRAGYRFRKQDIDWLGMSAVLPSALMDAPQLDKDSPDLLLFQGTHHSGLTLRLWSMDVSGSDPAITMRVILKQLEKQDPAPEVITSKSGRSGFAIAAKGGGVRSVYLADIRNGALQLAKLSLSSNTYDAMRPVVAHMLNGLELFAGPRLSSDERRKRIARGDDPVGETVPGWFRSMIGNGSGSLVTRDGHVLTNWHVVEGCGSLTVNGTPASLLGTDVRLDLALLQAPAFANKRPIRFRADNPQLGETVAVMGFPVFRYSRALNFTRGSVSSTVGLYGDRTRVQITAPIQPGNSGGPVLDTNGRQVAVVAAKANTAWQEADNIENVGWVIRGKNALAFMKQFDVVPIVEEHAAAAQFPSPEKIDQWRAAIVRIECHLP
ncbi:serine protease [Ruegeria halocynthiae]|uniref:serine protease n=1 Tax=Ruegeria halocynthiae TaxID=985054 RepID=UPI0006916FF7|nr:serine protease [Ruegeria halocynthiae]